MFEYKYVSIDARQGFGSRYFEEHQQIINQHAKEGWRFVTAIPVKSVGYGVISELDLVFEKEV